MSRSYGSYNPDNPFESALWDIFPKVLGCEDDKSRITQMIPLVNDEKHLSDKGILRINVPGYNPDTIKVKGDGKGINFYFKVSYLNPDRTVKSIKTFKFSKNRGIYDYSKGEAKVKDGVLKIVVPKKPTEASSVYEFNVS